MTALNMTVADALTLADDWIQGTTFHADSKGANAIMLVLAEEVRRLQSNQRNMAVLADERERETFAARLEAARLRNEAAQARGTSQFHKDNHLAAEAEVDRLRVELGNIAYAKPSQWDSDVRDQFQEWAQSRARAALAAMEATNAG